MKGAVLLVCCFLLVVQFSHQLALLPNNKASSDVKTEAEKAEESFKRKDLLLHQLPQRAHSDREKKVFARIVEEYETLDDREKRDLFGILDEVGGTIEDIADTLFGFLG